MNRSFAASALVATVLFAGCSDSTSPIKPSSVGANTVPGLAAATGGPEPSGSQGAQAVPFKGRFDGTQTLMPLQPPFGAVNGVATGQATHLGLFTVAFPHTVNFATRQGVGTYTFTAANGDTLTASFTGQAQGGPPVVAIVEQATVTGGTGRFADATGSFTVNRRFDQSSGTTEGSFDGAISIGAGSH
jgi:hypothetical protein